MQGDHLVMRKLFLYCPETAAHLDGMLTYFGSSNKNFTCVALEGQPEFFWDRINELDPGGTLVVLTHGDEGGPLLVKGNDGPPFTPLNDIHRLGMALENASLYLLSCHTGDDTGYFFNNLS